VSRKSSARGRHERGHVLLPRRLRADSPFHRLPNVGEYDPAGFYVAPNGEDMPPLAFFETPVFRRHS